MPTTRSLREGGCRKKHKRLEPQRHEDHKGKEKLFFVLFVMKALATEARRHRGKAFFSSPWRVLSWQRNPLPFYLRGSRLLCFLQQQGSGAKCTILRARASALSSAFYGLTGKLTQSLTPKDDSWAILKDPVNRYSLNHQT